ncbi:MAG: autotransporter outer membrane beta-barrel domain-containing protein [Hyphomicrobiales bacterium]
MKNSKGKYFAIALAGCLAATEFNGTSAFAQSLNNIPLTSEEKARYSELLFKSDKTAEEVSEWRQLHERMKVSMKPEDTTQYVSTQDLNRPYIEIAPDIGVTRLKAGVTYKDSFYTGSDGVDTGDASGTSARFGIDVRVNVPIQGGIELFAGGWSFGNVGGDGGLHNEQTIHLETGNGSSNHNLALTYSVNNILTGYAGIGIPIYYSYCDCFMGPKQVLLSPYAGLRVGQIKLDSYYETGGGNGSASDTETYVSPLIGLEIKARSGKIGNTGFQLNAAVGYQYQFGADSNFTTLNDNNSPTAEADVNFDIESQQHFYGSIRLVRTF